LNGYRLDGLINTKRNRLSDILFETAAANFSVILVLPTISCDFSCPFHVICPAAAAAAARMS